MARRKRHAKKTTHRRRRHHSMSGVKGGVMSAVGIIGGAVAAQFLAKQIDKMLPATMASGTKTLIDGAAPIALGLILPRFIKSDLGKNLGSGMIAVGGLKLAQSQISALSGMSGYNYGNMPVQAIAGYQTQTGGNYIAGLGGYQTSTPGNYIAGIAALTEMEKC
jgi:hypothetical protein